jgi:hypothetical protein
MTYQEIFKDAYLEKVGIPFMQWGGREAKSLKDLFAMVHTFWLEFKGINLDDEQHLDGFKDFLEGIEDDYILNTFTPSNIYSSFNQLAQAHYGKTYAKKDKTVKYTFELPTDEALKEIELIKEGYKRLKIEAPNTKKIGNIKPSQFNQEMNGHDK